MTGQQIVDMQKKLDFAKSLNGEIAILKERIGWLDSAETIKHFFVLGKQQVGKTQVELTDVDCQLEKEFSSAYKSFLEKKLQAKQSELDGFVL